jgi:hypothetical protein
VSAGSESSYRRAEAGRLVAAVAFGVALLAVSWALLHVGFFERNQIVDTPVYQSFGDAMTSGEVPYRDFSVEYPPAALPAFALPSLGAVEDYRTLFELLMWTCATATVALVAVALNAVGVTTARLFGAVAFVGLAPLALGSVVLTRYDLWPAALTAGGVAALVAGRHRLGIAALGAGAAAKVYPLVLLPIAIVWVWRRHGRREALASLGLFTAVLAAAVVPFAVLAPDGLADSIRGQLGRPLQIESLGAAVLLVAHQLGLYEPTVVSSSGSQNLAGALPDAFATVQSVVQALAVVAVWALFTRVRPTTDTLLAASAAALAAFVAFGKVLSPQFLIWLIPVVPLVAGAVGAAASGLLAGALVATQLWFPSRYWDVVGLSATGWLVLARDVLLAALFALLLTAIRRERAGLRTVLPARPRCTR